MRQEYHKSFTMTIAQVQELKERIDRIIAEGSPRDKVVIARAFLREVDIQDVIPWLRSHAGDELSFYPGSMNELAANLSTGYSYLWDFFDKEVYHRRDDATPVWCPESPDTLEQIRRSNNDMKKCDVKKNHAFRLLFLFSIPSQLLKYGPDSHVPICVHRHAEFQEPQWLQY